MNAAATPAPVLCECTQPNAHVHPNGDHFCSWCAGYLGNSRFGKVRAKVHQGGVCACPEKCPPDAHIRRRCR